MVFTSTVIGRALSSDGVYLVWHSVTLDDIPRTVDFGPTVGGRILDALKKHGVQAPESRALLGLSSLAKLRGRDGPRVSGAMVLAVAQKLSIDPYVLICGVARPIDETEVKLPPLQAGVINGVQHNKPTEEGKMSNLARDDSLFGADFTGHTDRLGELLTTLIEKCCGQQCDDSTGSAPLWRKSDIDLIEKGEAAPTRASLKAFLEREEVKAFGENDDRVRALQNFMEETADDPDEATDTVHGVGLDVNDVAASSASDGVEDGTTHELIVWNDPKGDGKGTVTVDGVEYELNAKDNHSVRRIFLKNLRKNREADDMTIPALSEIASTFMPEGEILPKEVIGNMWNHMTFLNQRRAEAYAQALQVDVASLLGVSLDRISEVNRLLAAEEPKAEEPKAEEPKAEEPKAEEPKAEEPKAEEPKAEEPKAEEPKAEEPKAEEPKAEEPKAEETHAADASDEDQSPAVSTETDFIQAWLLAKLEGGHLPEEVAKELAQAQLTGAKPDYLRLLGLSMDCIYPELRTLLAKACDEESDVLCVYIEMKMLEILSDE